MKPHNIIELLSRIVKHHSEKPALVWRKNEKERVYTYQQLWYQIHDVAYGLQKLGIQAGDKVAIYARSNPRAIICDLAILSLGGISVPIDPLRSKEQVYALIQHANITSILIENPGMLEEIQHLLPHMKHVALLTGRSYHVGAVTFDTMVQLGQTISNDAYQLPYPSIQQQDPATMIYLFEKERIRALTYSHGNILQLVHSLSYLLPISVEDQFSSCLPYSYYIERLVGHFYPLLSGSSISYLDSTSGFHPLNHHIHSTVCLQTPESLQQLERELQQTASTKTTTLEKVIPSRIQKAVLDRFIKKATPKKLGEHLRYLISTEPLTCRCSTIEEHLEGSIFELFGTEDCPVIAVREHQGDDEKVFTPLPSVDVRVSTDSILLVKSQMIRIEESCSDPDYETNMKNGWLSTGTHVALTARCHLQMQI
ncbi:Long-chain acyl-CoA synthetase (AMP-forming) [Thermoactinomyces sp. DSM 45891]|uniref:AMP-binding protein n=1 Tax=Thermoactinomyces sp. DSM 45891 TaxID=1761907 RepID=UPI00091CE746|nr:AMP-binding protein [Thermoactinomyces sp. DSM 45891]SFX68484.1 Long-chain acyl-CoA synthetase (AMP-forming) [Thermoactinomyces sp. DSM 45891]